ncbi:MAG TPA: HAD-IC family P-type ATPase, partial [Polyangiales bacterium]
MQPPPKSAHALPLTELIAALNSDASHGLSAQEASARLGVHGPNALPEAPPSSLWLVFVHQFQSPLVYLLLIAAAIAFALGHLSDGSVIVVVVVLNAVIGMLQEGRAERSLAALRSMVQQHARVVRDGHDADVLARDLVPGDLISLQAGDAVSADARVVEAAQLSVTEAALTGESVPVQKTPGAAVAADAPLAERTNMLFAGTSLNTGRARALVVATGLGTEIGKIAQLAERSQQAKTPLELRVAQFGRVLSYAALGMFLLVVGIGFVRQIEPSALFMVAISQVVGLIPEGLPVAMTIALALGVTRMAKRGAIVRRLSAVETLGSTTVIASDKTGTLTRNEMTVTQLFLGSDRTLTVEGIGLALTGVLREPGKQAGVDASDQELEALLQVSVLCNDANLEVTGAGQAPRALGDPTEVALVVLARKAGLDVDALRRRLPRAAEVPFDSDKKWMATQHTDAGGPFIALKGAPEAIFALCIEGPALQAARRASEALAADALRVIAIARIDQAQLSADAVALPKPGRLLGLVGQLDPPRDEAREAVARCKQAGIRAVMITGDHKATAVAIGKALGITRQGRDAVDGKELGQLSEEALMQRLPAIDVFARVEPAQKLRIVEALQRQGEVVAMTGDGVNDAPALTRADVGVAMGIKGTEATKEAADIVLADDNFATIVAAVEEGRVVYANLQKAVLLLLSTSVAEVVVLTGALVLGLPPPFAAVQILWNNLITEGLITVNLVMEPAEGNEMARPPIPRGERLLSGPLLRRLYLLTPVIALINLAWFSARLLSGVPFQIVQSETFTLLAVCEWFNVLNCRSQTESAFSLGFGRNPWLLSGLVAGVALQAAVLYVPVLQRLFHTTSLSIGEMGWIVASGSVVL